MLFFIFIFFVSDGKLLYCWVIQREYFPVPDAADVKLRKSFRTPTLRQSSTASQQT